MLKLTEVIPVQLPNYIISEELNKKNLLKICLEDDKIKHYLPDSTNLVSIERDFLLSV